jgi:hypothetical protein
MAQLLKSARELPDERFGAAAPFETRIRDQDAHQLEGGTMALE